jgi:hypothetical protein
MNSVQILNSAIAKNEAILNNAQLPEGQLACLRQITNRLYNKGAAKLIFSFSQIFWLTSKAKLNKQGLG